MSTNRNTQSTAPINDPVQQLIDEIAGEIEVQSTDPRSAPIIRAIATAESVVPFQEANQAPQETGWSLSRCVLSCLRNLKRQRMTAAAERSRANQPLHNEPEPNPDRYPPPLMIRCHPPKA